MKLFIGPLSVRMTNDELQSFLTNNNVTVSNLEIQLDRTTGRSRRFAIAEVSEFSGPQTINNILIKELE